MASPDSVIWLRTMQGAHIVGDTLMCQSPEVLMRKKIIPIEQLIDGQYYYGHSRPSNIARWDAHTRLFYMWREKFTSKWLVTERHFDEEPTFDAFRPYEEVDWLVDEIPIDRTLGFTGGA